MIALYNGTIYSGKRFYEAILLDGKWIKSIGSNEAIRRQATSQDQQIDLGGRLVLPGFIDSHAHGPLSISRTLGKIDLYPAETQDQYLQIIRQFVEENPEQELYSGMGWLNPAFGERGPDKESLDAICSSKPIVLCSGDGHSTWGNSRAIELAGITRTSEDPEGGTIERNADGSIRGTFRDQAKDYLQNLVPDASADDYKEALMNFQDMMAGYGHTAVFDAMVDLNSNMHQAYRELNRDEQLKIKCVLAYTSDPENPELSLAQYEKAKVVKEGKLTEGTIVKVFVDGVVEGGTAFLKEEYCHQKDYYGEPLWEQEALNQFCAAVDRMGYDLHFHVIGDAAAAEMLTAMEFVHQKNGEKLRNTVAAHMQLVDPKDYQRLKALDIRISSNPYWFVKAPGYYENIELPFLGNRAELEYPMKSFFDLGLIVSAGSDYGVTPQPYPPAGMQIALLRTLYGKDHTILKDVLNAAEAIDLEEALDAFTINGANTMGIEDMTGSLEVGKHADLVVMEQNLFDTDAADFYRTEVYMTISEGEIIYKKREWLTISAQ